MDSPPNTTTMSPHPRCIPHIPPLPHIPPAVSPTSPPPCPHPRSLVQHAAPDDPQVLEDTQVLPAGRPSGNVEEAWGQLSVTHAPTLWTKTPPTPDPPTLTRQLLQALEDPQQFGVQGRCVGAGVSARDGDGREGQGGGTGDLPRAWGSAGELCRGTDPSKVSGRKARLPKILVQPAKCWMLEAFTARTPLRKSTPSP